MSLMLDVLNKLKELSEANLTDFNRIDIRAISAIFLSTSNDEYPVLYFISNSESFENVSRGEALHNITFDAIIGTQIFSKESYCILGEGTSKGIYELSDAFFDMLNQYPQLDMLVDKRLIDISVTDEGIVLPKVAFQFARRIRMTYGKVEDFKSYKGG